MPFAEVSPSQLCACGHPAGKHLDFGEHVCTRAGCLCTGFELPDPNRRRRVYSRAMRTTRQWSDPVKDKQPRPETLNIKGDLEHLKGVLRRVVRKSGPGGGAPVPTASKPK